jgi:peptide/nickel transport system substrate-binding protein
VIWRGLLVATLSLAAGCAYEDTQRHGAIIVAMTNSAAVLDPRIGTDEVSQKAHQLLFNSLVRVGADLRVVPELAESLENPDPLTYIARLRRGVLFHNGRELTADDVVYTFRSFLDPTFGGRSGAYRLMAAVNPLDNYTVEFKLKEPFGAFGINLVMGIVQAGSGTANVRQPVGTGPYKLAQFIPDDRLVLAPFEEYWEGPPRNAGVILKVVPDDTMRGLELRKGAVDLVVNDIAPDVVWQLREEGRLQVVTAPGTDYAYIGVNLTHPILSKLEVRQAIAMAVDRDAIVTHLRRGLATPAVGIVPPMSWAFERDVSDVAHDPAGAARLLDAAGYGDPDGGGPQTRFALTLRTSTTEVYRLQAAAIQHDLGRVGVRVDVRSTESLTLFTDIARGNFQLYTAVFVGVTDPDMLRRVFHSAQKPPAGLNRVFYSNGEVDRLIDAAARVPDERERRALYGRAQQITSRDLAYVPLWYRQNVAVSQPDIRGIALSPTAEFSFLRHVFRASPDS